MEWIDKEKVIEAVEKYKDVIVGLKARMSKSVVCDSGIEPPHVARSLSRETSLPIMVHIGSAPPRIEEVVPLLEKDDVITHYLNGKENNLFDEEGKPLPVLLDAVKRGVHLDVGHGNASFSFKVAEARSVTISSLIRLVQIFTGRIVYTVPCIVWLTFFRNSFT